MELMEGKRGECVIERGALPRGWSEHLLMFVGALNGQAASDVVMTGMS